MEILQSEQLNRCMFILLVEQALWLDQDNKICRSLQISTHPEKQCGHRCWGWRLLRSRGAGFSR
jgi:hypothetical protein